MSPPVTYAWMTLLVGVILLLGWLYANVANPRCRAMLLQSLFYFGVPMIFQLENFIPVQAMWAWVSCEEAVKAFASTREKKNLDRFWLVSLFGIWELAVIKPPWGATLAQQIGNWSGFEISGLVYVATLPVLMHSVTAAIYAFTPVRRLWLAFIASWFVHMTFNNGALYNGFSAEGVVVETLVLAVILAGILCSNARRQASKGAN